jgi:hypothetical protein
MRTVVQVPCVFVCIFIDCMPFESVYSPLISSRASITQRCKTAQRVLIVFATCMMMARSHLPAL